jgi:predicted branched-subunit amino acid permease
MSSESNPASHAGAEGYGSRRAAVRGGARDALGVPSIVLGASFVGFGALVREAGLTVWHGLFSSATAWALPGQVALVELYSVGASVLAVALAVALTNARLLPMTIALMPLLRARGRPRWQYYLAANWIAVTGWAAQMRKAPHLPEEERLSYFGGFAALLWTATLFGTAAGFLLAESVPPSVSLGLVFLNPIYFMLVFASEWRQRSRALALAFGAVTGPLLHLVSPDWGLLLTGLLAGTLAFALDRLLAARAERGA